MRVWSLKNLEDIRHEYIDFDGEWYQAFGRPEKSGCWIIYGKSGQGKSSFALQLARKLDEMGMRVLYLTLEMGGSTDFLESVRDVIIIDSVQYFTDQCGVKADEIISLRKKYPRKVFIFISHVDGKEVEGQAAYRVKRDSFKRIYVQGFKATFVGRGKGGPRGFFIIWAKGYQEYHLKNIEINGTEEEHQEAD